MHNVAPKSCRRLNITDVKKVPEDKAQGTSINTIGRHSFLFCNDSTTYILHMWRRGGNMLKMKNQTNSDEKLTIANGYVV